MPKGKFYAGLTLVDQLQKLVDHHHDPKVRHISSYEASMIDRAIARLRQPLSPRETAEEYELVWQRLGHLYTTVVASDRLQLQMISIPHRPGAATPAALLEELELDVLVRTQASPRTAQIAFNTLVRHAVAPTLDLQAMWDEASARRSPPADPELGDIDNELMNRALYQPTVAVEESPPIFVSLAEVLAANPDSWQTMLVDKAGDPATMITAGGMILFFTVLRGPAEGLRQGLQERFYRLSRPDEEPEGADAQKEKNSESDKPQKDDGGGDDRDRSKHKKKRRKKRSD